MNSSFADDSTTLEVPGAAPMEGDLNTPVERSLHAGLSKFNPLNWWSRRTGTDSDGVDPNEDSDPLWDSDETIAMLGSMQVHIIIFLSLALIHLQKPFDDEAVVMIAAPPEYEETLESIEEFVVSDMPQTEVGADALAELDMAEASAEVYAEVADIPNPVDLQPTDLGQIMVNKIFTQPAAPQKRLVTQKGSTGVGVAGAQGAVDQITAEITLAAEERPTLVVWLFDQSGSLTRQRTDIRDRFDRIYDELGLLHASPNDKKTKPDDERILTSIIGFGERVELYTEKPTADLKEIKKIVDNIPVDNSGVERVFTAIESAAKEYKPLRRNVGPNGPKRNVLFVVVTDEKGDDYGRLETSIDSCRKLGIPVYVVGVPAPFGREHTLVKYVDPDPQYDQSPQWAQVDQGPETFLPERIQLSFTGNFEEEPVIDSGFGPYGLTRLCYETGGIYFTVHPSRNTSREVRRREIEAFSSDMRFFFDPTAMIRYRPDYLSQEDYVSSVKRSPLRMALVQAATIQNATGIQRPRLRFVKTNEAQLAGELTKAQQDAAPLEPTLIRLAATLQQGLSSREEEKSPRWLAGFDLAYGRVLAQKVRTETYNAVLAQAKQGMPFKEKKNNTWVLEPSDEISVGSKWQREADTAREFLTRVVDEHPGTPWALLAQRELDVPIGWTWKETFTDTTPRTPRQGGNNNNNTPKDDERRMLNRAPKRPVPKL